MEQNISGNWNWEIRGGDDQILDSSNSQPFAWAMSGAKAAFEQRWIDHEGNLCWPTHYRPFPSPPRDEKGVQA